MTRCNAPSPDGLSGCEKTAPHDGAHTNTHGEAWAQTPITQSPTSAILILQWADCYRRAHEALVIAENNLRTVRRATEEAERNTEAARQLFTEARNRFLQTAMNGAR